MASGVNRVILVGRLGKDPDVRNGNDGEKWAQLSVATSEYFKDKKTGERADKTEWHRVVVFEQNAVKFAEQYLKKGMQVYVEGKNATRKYQKDGVDHYITEVTVNLFGGRLLSLEAVGEGKTTGEGSYGNKRGDLDDDIPF